MLSLLFSSVLFVQTFAVPESLETTVLDLQTAIQKAIVKNEVFLQANEGVNIQKGLARQSLSVILPQIQGTSQLSDPQLFGLGVTLPLFNLSGVFGTHSAYKRVDAAQAGYQRKRDALVFEVTQVYLDALLAQHLFELAVKQHETSEIRLASQKRKADAGEISRLDLKRAELLATKTKIQIKNHQAGLRTAKGALAHYLGENEIFKLQDAAVFVKTFKKNDQELIRQARENRSDLKSLNIAIQAAWLGKQQANWNFMPTLQLNSSWNVPTGKDWQWHAQVNVSVPFFDGGNRYGQMRVADALWRQEKLKKDLLERELSLGVQGALVEISRYEAVYDLQMRLVEISEIAVKSAENRYSLGHATSLDVLEEQIRLFEAQNDFQKSRFNLEKSRLYLSYVLGDPREGLKLNG